MTSASARSGNWKVGSAFTDGDSSPDVWKEEKNLCDNDRIPRVSRVEDEPPRITTCNDGRGIGEV